MLQIADTPQKGTIKVETTTGQFPGETYTTRDMTDHRRLQVNTRKWVLAREDSFRGELLQQYARAKESRADCPFERKATAERLARIETVRTGGAVGLRDNYVRGRADR